MKVAQSGNRIRNLVKQILLFSRQSEPKREAFQLRGIVEDALEFLHATIPTTISLIQETESDCPSIWGDPNQIYQAILNLCINSSQASKSSINFAP